VQLTQGKLTVAAGQSEDVTLRMPRGQLTALKLVPANNANENVAGLLELVNGGGESQYITLSKTLNTIFASGKKN